MPSRRRRRAGWSTHVNSALATLETCIEENNPQSIRQCVGPGLDVNANLPVSGLTPLELALQKRDLSILQELLDLGADPEGKNSQGTTMLTTAIRYGYLDGVKLLVQHGANVNARSENGMPCFQFALEKEHYSIAAYFLEEESFDVNVCGTDGRCLLELLVLANDTALISSLKNRGVSLDTQFSDGTVALVFAIKHGKSKALKGLLEAGADPNIGTETGDFALHEAVRRNNIKAVKNLMAHGANASILDKGGLTPIHVAIERKSMPVLKVLFYRRTNIEQRCTRGSTPLITACRMGWLEAVELLVGRGANVNARCYNRMTCLDVAQEKAHYSIVAYLLEQNLCEIGALGRDGPPLLQNFVLADNATLIVGLSDNGLNLNTRLNGGTVAVFLAVRHCKNKALKALLEAGADPNIGTTDGDYALHEALRQNNMKAVKHLMEHGADTRILNKDALTPIDVAINRQYVPMLRLLLECGVEIDHRCSGGATLLLAACSVGYLEGVQLLVENGANMYVRGSDGESCAQVALEKEHYSIVAYFLQQDTPQSGLFERDVFSYLQSLILDDDAASILRLKQRVPLEDRCPDGFPLVCYAITHCKNEALKALLEAGADPDVCNADGDYALHEAMERNNADAVRHLMLHGANDQSLGERYEKPMQTTLYGHRLSMLRALLDGGADIEQNVASGSTPLVVACSQGFLEGVQLLVERGANLNARAANGRACLLLALDNGHQSIVDYLIDQEACDVNIRGPYGLRGLHYAVVFNNANMMRKLLQEEADVNVQNHDGEMPVFLAAKYGKLDLLRMLLEAGAVPNFDTKDGDFALHEAVKHGDVEAVELLLQYGADKERLDKNGMTPLEVAMALVPPPQDIINCLLTAHMDDQDVGVSHSIGHPAGDNRKISVAELEEALCCCPITFEVMKDPVIAMDGHTYEREAIERWIREKRESPVTRQPMTSAVLIPNLTVRHLIDQLAKVDNNA